MSKTCGHAVKVLFHAHSNKLFGLVTEIGMFKQLAHAGSSVVDAVHGVQSGGSNSQLLELQTKRATELTTARVAFDENGAI